MSVIFLLLILGGLVSGKAHADVFVTTEKLSVSGETGLMTLVELTALTSNSAHTNCAPVVEVPGAYVCVFASQSLMNNSLTRAGVFWGTLKNTPIGTIIPNDDVNLLKIERSILGHNLPGEIVSEFFQKLNDPASGGPNADEKIFDEGFVQSPDITNLKQHYYVIALSADALETPRIVISHELHHAQYYLNSKLKSAVQDFWSEMVTSQDRSEIRRILGNVYNIANDDTVIDEFQAYLLQDDFAHALLSQYAGLYRDRLIAYLKQNADYDMLVIK